MLEIHRKIGHNPRGMGEKTKETQGQWLSEHDGSQWRGDYKTDWEARNAESLGSQTLSSSPVPSTNPCFLEEYLPKTRLCEASSQEKDDFKETTKHVDGESFQIHKKNKPTENRTIDPFANRQS